MKKYIWILAILLLLSSCEAVQTTEVPPSETSPETSESAPSSSEQPPEEEEKFPGFDKIPGGIIYTGSQNGSYLLNADGLVDMGNLTLTYNADGTKAYYIKSSDGSADGDTALFDSSGNQLSEYEARTIQMVAGDYIVRGNYEITESDGYIFSTDVAFIDLATGETVWEPGRCVIRKLDSERLTVCVQEEPDAVPKAMVVSIDDLSVIKEFEGYYGTSGSWQYAPIPDNSLLLFDEGAEKIWLYDLEREEMYPDYQRVVGDAVLLGNEGDYRLLLPDGDQLPVNDGMDYWYWSDSIKYWQDSNGSYYCTAACYSDMIMPVQYVQCDDYNDQYIVVCLEDGTLDILSQDGELLSHIEPEEGIESFSVGNGWVMRRSETGVGLLAPDGREYQFDGLMNIWPLCEIDGQQYFSAQMEDYTMSVVDKDGNLLISGLSSVYAPSDEAGLLVVMEDERVGLMDIEGNWLWREPEMA